MLALRAAHVCKNDPVITQFPVVCRQLFTVPNPVMAPGVVAVAATLPNPGAVAGLIEADDELEVPPPPSFGAEVNGLNGSMSAKKELFPPPI